MASAGWGNLAPEKPLRKTASLSGNGDLYGSHSSSGGGGGRASSSGDSPFHEGFFGGVMCGNVE